MRNALIAAVVVALVAIGIVISLWQDRADLESLGWPEAKASIESGNAVTVTWLGVTTLLFDDNETQVLIDGFFTRRPVYDYLFKEISTDIAKVNYALAEFRINRLAAVVPVHSHFDHAMDVGIVANRTSAVVLGSESTANIVRGARLPISQYQILADRESRQFGNFTIRLIVSEHAPLADGENPWIPGHIDKPLRQPARVSEWKEGESYSIVISHPNGTTLVQGSAGFVINNLKNVSADVVMLGVGGLSTLGENYAGRYWHETVELTGAKRVFPIHYDDFALPFGEIAANPAIVDDTAEMATWINGLADITPEQPEVLRLPFGKRVLLY